MPSIKFENFKPDTTYKENSEIAAKHPVIRGTIPGSNKLWIAKKADHPIAAYQECLAQEIMRLFNPHQPETRLMVDKKNKKTYVLSKEIRGFKSLPTGEQTKFDDNIYTGLGTAMISALFIEESDFKIGNVCLDDRGHVLKIDGDHTFSSFDKLKHKAHTFNVTPSLIEVLPRVNSDYTPYNWLDFIAHDIFYRNSKVIANSYKRSKKFIYEKNLTILKIILTPDDLLNKLAAIHMPIHKQKQKHLNLLKRKKTAFLNASANLKSFQDYLKTPQAIKDTIEYFKDLTSIRTNDEDLIPDNELTNFLDTFCNGTTAIHFDKQYINALISTHSTLETVFNLKSGMHDSIVNKYINIVEIQLDNLISKQPDNLIEINKIKNSIHNVIDTLRNKKLITVNQLVRDIREDSLTAFKLLFFRMKANTQDNISHIILKIKNNYNYDLTNKLVNLRVNQIKRTMEKLIELKPDRKADIKDSFSLLATFETIQSKSDDAPISANGVAEIINNIHNIDRGLIKNLINFVDGLKPATQKDTRQSTPPLSPESLLFKFNHEDTLSIDRFIKHLKTHNTVTKKSFHLKQKPRKTFKFFTHQSNESKKSLLKRLALLEQANLIEQAIQNTPLTERNELHSNKHLQETLKKVMATIDIENTPDYDTLSQIAFNEENAQIDDPTKPTPSSSS